MSNTSTTVSKPDPKIIPGKKYRFVVRSAEEAVKIIQERMGGQGRVLSVRQIDGQGLSRFLSSPKLEVVSHIPAEENDDVKAHAPGQRFNVTLPDDEETPDQENFESPVDDNEEPNTSSPVESKAEAKPNVRKNPTKAYRRDAPDIDNVNLSKVLRTAGFDNTLLTSLENSPKWEKICELPVPRALTEVSRWLRQDYERIDTVNVTGRMAFLGTPGVGKTTALCKRISHDVLMKGARVHVLKVDQDMPNPDDALRLFCDVMGANFFRDPASLNQIPDNETVYLDFPGIHRSREEDWIRVRRSLDDMKVDTRILIINTVYESSMIRDALRMGSTLGATHLVFTHLDELSQATKLWPIVRHSGLSPLFASYGQNVAGDYSDDVLSALLERTFPRKLL
ncbi:MAG: hypothetical protein ACPGN3_01815 [Opitutales bacterium]